MAVQCGPNLFRGKLGGITGYVRNNKYMLRKSSSLSREQMLRNPRSVNTFMNAFDMGTAISSGSLIRKDLKHLLSKGKDSQHHNRLSGLLRRALNVDSVNLTGRRNLHYCDLSSLKGYNFNLNGLLNSCFKGSYQALINRKKGVASLRISDFVAGRHLKVPAGATHFEVISICSEINFEASSNFSSSKTTGLLAVGDKSVRSFELVHNFRRKSSDQILLMMGIRYYQEVNGVWQQMNSREFCPLSIVEVGAFLKDEGEVFTWFGSVDKKLMDREFERMMEVIRRE